MMIFAAILAGGMGTRMGLDIPKQFMMIGDRPILIHSIDNFLKVTEIDKLIVSSPQSHIKDTEDLIKDYIGDNERIVVIEGGEKRSDTIMNSIDYVLDNYDEGDHIMVTHDAARIFASPDLIKKSIDETIDHDAASPVIPAVDVIFESKVEGKLTDIPLRANLRHSQTPQTFKINRYIEILNDLTEEEKDKLDEAMILFFMRAGDISLFEGETTNFKITRDIDVEIAEVYLKKLSQ